MKKIISVLSLAFILSTLACSQDTNSFEKTKALAESGNAKSQYELAMMYIDGQGINKNEKEAFKWYQESAKLEYAPAYYQIGRMYEYGLGVEKNNTESNKWYKESADKLKIAAEKGDAESQRFCGHLFRSGKGEIRQDYQEAAFNHLK